jgi:hypothetical protein
MRTVNDLGRLHHHVRWVASGAHNIQGKTPFIREVPFRTWRARSCTITVAGNAFRSGEDVRLQLLCRARSRAACTPVSD